MLANLATKNTIFFKKKNKCCVKIFYFEVSPENKNEPFNYSIGVAW
jgi:hypothetical protein